MTAVSGGVKLNLSKICPIGQIAFKPLLLTLPEYKKFC
jgi:hypothetical protein